MIKNVLTMGDPQLKQVAQAVQNFSNKSLQHTIDDMLDTMRHFQGVGLAAPQIACLQRIIVLEVKENTRYPQASNIDLEILINPVINSQSAETEKYWEACLSLPKMRGNIARAKTIRYQYQDVKGQQHSKTATGFHARIIQHEMDHLNGILYPQRLDELFEFGFEESLGVKYQLK